MLRTFAYIRVSKYNQETDNHIGGIEAVGFSIVPNLGEEPRTCSASFQHIIRAMQ